MNPFKERLIELVFNILAWSILVFVFILVGGGAILFTTHFPYIVMGFVLLIVVIFVGIYMYTFINWLFVEPYKSYKKEKTQ